MFDIGWSEIGLIAGAAVLLLKPEDMPKALYNAGKVVRKFKVFTADIQHSLDKIMHDAELEEITREANKIGSDTIQFEIEKQLQEEEKRVMQGALSSNVEKSTSPPVLGEKVE